MRAELKGLHSPDVLDLENWMPDDPECFGFLLQIMAGSPDTEGADTFDAMVCTPAWFAKHELSKGRGIMAVEHTVFVQGYDYRLLVAFIERYCRRCEGASWNEVAAKLGRLGHWEFENYKERLG